MIDLHCHILDGTACGPESFAECLEMCRLAVEEGVRTIVATPRWEAHSVEPPLPFIEGRRRLERLQDTMGGALAFKLGFMMQFSPQLPSLVRQYGSVLALAGGRHILVSLPSLSTPAEAEAVWKRVAELGFYVVISRPECSSDLRRDPARLERWVASEVMLQMDAASVTGAHGREVQRFAERCIERYESQVVVASNARDASKRRSSLGLAREKLAKTIGARRTQILVSETPSQIINTNAARPRLRVQAVQSRFTAFLRPLRPKKILIDAS